jgi:hypothetical protein
VRGRQVSEKSKGEREALKAGYERSGSGRTSIRTTRQDGVATCGSGRSGCYRAATSRGRAGSENANRSRASEDGPTLRDRGGEGVAVKARPRVGVAVHPHELPGRRQLVASAASSRVCAFAPSVMLGLCGYPKSRFGRRPSDPLSSTCFCYWRSVLQESDRVGELTPFDLTVLLIISNVVQNAIIGPDNSLGGGLIGAAVIFLANYLVAEITFRSRRLRRLLEAAPTLLVHNGRILHKNLTSERVTLDELHAALRRSGVPAVEQVRAAVLKENGGPA